MKVYYKKGEHVIIKFGNHELKQALGVLKALAQYFKATFLLDVAADLQRDLDAPPLLTYKLRYRCCENCFTMIDTRTDEYMHVDDTYLHKNCPQLKENRP